MRRKNSIFHIVSIVLITSLLFPLYGCGKKGLNEYQQQFVDSVGVAETATEETSLNTIKDAFVKYSTLSEKDAQNEKVEEAKTKLVTLFDSKVEALSKEEMSASLDAKISEFETVVNELPVELQSSIPGCEQIKTIRDEHLKWYVNQNEILADKIDEINKQFDALNLAETAALIDETIPLFEDMKNLSYEKDMEEIKNEYGMISPAESIEVLEKVKNLIPEMCYTDCYVVRFEYICDYTVTSDNTMIGDYYLYGFSSKNKVWKTRTDYIDYLDAHFEQISFDPYEAVWKYDIGCDKPLEVSDYFIDSMGIYGVMVVPPYVSPEEHNI